MKAILFLEIGLVFLAAATSLANERIDPGHPPDANTLDSSGSSSLPTDPEQAAQVLRQQAEQRERQIGDAWTSESSPSEETPSAEE
jgi:hypothetical protein